MSPKKRDKSRDSIEEMFLEEREALCAELSENLMALEKHLNPSRALQNLMRAAHSLKGAARLVGRRSLESIAHVMEDCFVLTQHGVLTLGSKEIGVLLKAVDFVANARSSGEMDDLAAFDAHPHLTALERISRSSAQKPDEPTNTPVSDTPGVAPEGTAQMALVPTRDRYLRVSPETLGRLLSLASDSLSESRWLQGFLDNMRKATRKQSEKDQAARWLAESALDSANIGPVREVLGQTHLRVAELSNALKAGVSALEAHECRIAQISRRLYLEVLRTRMRPFSDVSMTFARSVRDMAVSLGKRIRLDVSGEGTLVDREVLASVESAIVHLLRNAVDHGCESPEERERAGKPPEAVVHLSVRQTAGTLEVSVADDGSGVDPTRLREAAAATKNAVSATEAADEDLLDLLFLPGFTLSQQVSDISGRGVGLDVVHNTVKRLRGSVRIENEPGKGMRVTLYVPLTISIVRCLLMHIWGEPYAIHMSAIQKVRQFTPQEIVPLQGRQHLKLAEEHIPLASGSEVIGCGAANQANCQVLILGERKIRAALIVDEFLGERDLAVQPLDPRFGKVDLFSAASILEDGRPVLVFDPEHLIRLIVSGTIPSTPKSRTGNTAFIE